VNNTNASNTSGTNVTNLTNISENVSKKTSENISAENTSGKTLENTSENTSHVSGKATNFIECENAPGNMIEDSYPRKCRASNGEGEVFVEFICNAGDKSMSLDEAIVIAKRSECGNDLKLNCVCPAGYVQEGATCNPRCYYDTPKCLSSLSPVCEETYFCNNNTGTLWIDMNITKEGCSPACVVNLADKSAEINWRCTGLITPDENFTEQAVCADPPCLVPYFLACNPSELTMPFLNGTNYVITVFRLEDGKCHYGAKITDKDGKAIPDMLSLDCRVPMDKLSMDTLDHFFGGDKVPGKEAIRDQQEKLQADYCVNYQTSQPKTPA
jgi:hypothetical protein